jgi:tRNA(Ile)-lysidine synthase
MRSVVRLLLAVGGDEYAPRHERLAAMMEAMAGWDGKSRLKRTLGGAVMETRDGSFAFYRELGRDGLPSVAVKAGFSGVWDRRFAVAVGTGAPAGLVLGPLGDDTGPFVRLRGRCPAAALAALPVLRSGGKVVAGAGLGLNASFPVEIRSLLGERLVRPPLFPDLAVGG